MNRLALVCAIALTAAACGTPPPAPDAQDGPAARSTPQKYRGNGLVLEEEGRGPELCLGGVNDSLPPQCSGIPLEGWDWDAVDGEETAAGTTFGHYEVTGFYDGKTLEVTEVGSRAPFPEDDPIGAACEEPAGGWERPQPDLVYDADLRKTIAIAEDAAEFSGAWIDYLDEPTEFEDPQDIVLSLAFTGDIDAHEAEARETWGGPLCVVEYERAYRELRRIQDELSDHAAEDLGLEMLWTDTDVVDNHVEIGVVVIDPATQAEIDDRYGAGTVRVIAQLRPVD